MGFSEFQFKEDEFQLFGLRPTFRVENRRKIDAKIDAKICKIQYQMEAPIMYNLKNWHYGNDYN